MSLEIIKIDFQENLNKKKTNKKKNKQKNEQIKSREKIPMPVGHQR